MGNDKPATGWICDVCGSQSADEHAPCSCDDDTTELIAEIRRLRAAPLVCAPRCARQPFDVRCADALADEVDVLVRQKVIDSRSPAADALLSYRDPPTSERSDRLLALTAENTKLREALSNAAAMLECRSDRAARLEWASELRKKL